MVAKKEWKEVAKASHVGIFLVKGAARKKAPKQENDSNLQGATHETSME
jgi:hypothetical protein